MYSERKRIGNVVNGTLKGCEFYLKNPKELRGLVVDHARVKEITFWALAPQIPIDRSTLLHFIDEDRGRKPARLTIMKIYNFLEKSFNNQEKTVKTIET